MRRRIAMSSPRQAALAPEVAPDGVAQVKIARDKTRWQED
jgi:hypothetical protein